MFNSAIIEIGLGLILLYLVVGLLCTSINEYLAQLLSLRAENLAETLHGLFTGPDRHRIAEDILDHPLVKSLSRKQFGLNLSGEGKLVGEIIKLPSSIPAETFSMVLKDLLHKAETDPDHDRYHAEITELLELLGVPATGAKAAVMDKVETWYNDAMERARGWYKRKAQVLSFMVSFAIVLVINADTILMVDRLANMPAERAKIVAYAEKVKSTGEGANREIQIPEELKDESLSFLGWTEAGGSDPRRVPSDPGGWLIKLFGLSLTAFAASLGAPFWFDLLSKVMTVRTGGNPPPPSDDDKTKAKAKGGTT